LLPELLWICVLCPYLLLAHTAALPASAGPKKKAGRNQNGDFSLKGKRKASKMTATSIVDKPAQIGAPQTHRAQSNTPGRQMKQVVKLYGRKTAVRGLIFVTATATATSPLPLAHHEH
jgi:hypothetical protein